MTAKEAIEALSKFDPGTKLIMDFSEGDNCWMASDRIKAAYVSDSGQLYYDPEDAIESEDDWGGELEEVVAIKSLVI